MSEPKNHSLIVSFCLLIVLIAGWFVFSPGLSGPFMLDDFDNLRALEAGVTDAGSFEEFLNKGNAGPLDRPISKISFLLNDNAWPSDPFSFKQTNILIHLLIGVLLFAAVRVLIRTIHPKTTADYIALFAVALWLLHPFQVSTVLYVIQRMTQMSTLFMVLGFLVHVTLRLRTANSDSLLFLALISLNLGLCTLLAMFSKENGALLPVYVAVTELTLLSRLQASQLFRIWRWFALWLPSLLIIGYILYIPKWIGGYANREFSLTERLLTESVIIWDYLHSIFTLEVYKLGLFNDDYPIYSNLWSWKPALAVFGILAAILAGVFFRSRLPIVSFGILWFLVGHLIESTTVPLELYFEHRNYLSIAGLTVAFVVLFHALFQKLSIEFSRFFYVFSSVLILVSASITWGFSNEWGSADRIYSIWAAEHPNSPRAQRSYAQHLANSGLPDMALDSLDYSHEKFPYDLSIPFMSAGISCAFDREFRFDFPSLKGKIDEFRWTDALRPAASHLQQIMTRTSCKPLAPMFAEILTETERFDRNKAKGIASLLVIAGNMYLSVGDGDSALKWYVRVDEIKPSVDSATRISGLFLGAGRYREARNALEIAIERDAVSGISPEKMEEYRAIFDLIDKNLQQE